jgi:hypothetical protein
MVPTQRVAIVILGCGHNEVSANAAASGYEVVDDWDRPVRSAETSAETSTAISIARTASGDWEDPAGQWR